MNLDARSALENPQGQAIRLPHPQGDGIALTDRADLGCILCAATADVAAFPKLLAEVLAIPMPDAPGYATRCNDMLAMWLSPRTALLLCPLDEETRLFRTIEAQSAGRAIHPLQYSDQLSWLELAGTAADSLLKQGGFLTLEPSAPRPDMARRTLIAGIPVILIHVNRGWLLGVERSHARYFSTWLAAAHARVPQQWRTT